MGASEIAMARGPQIEIDKDKLRAGNRTLATPKLNRACNSVQCATASVAFTATLALCNL